VEQTEANTLLVEPTDKTGKAQGAAINDPTGNRRIRVVQASSAQPPADVSVSDEGPDKSPLPSSNIETITVTGTSIRGTGNLTSPTIVIDRTTIDRSGYTDTQQLMASLPQNFSGGALGASPDGLIGPGGQAGFNQGAATGINLRGLGNSSTLVLLNGNRIAPADLGQFPDISLIPLEAIERIDVVTDGSSAIYGSDAVGGVVNFVLRRDFDGEETNVRYGTVTAGSLTEVTIDQTVGRKWDTGGFLVTAQYQDEGALSAADRSFTSTTTLPTSILPEFHSYSGLFSGHQDVSSKVDASLDALVSQKDNTNDLSTPYSSTILLNRHDQYDVDGTVGYKPFGDWRIEFDGTFSQSYDSETYTKFLPLIPGLPIGTALGTFTDTLQMGTLKADGTLFVLPGGAVKAAIGGSFSTQDFSETDNFSSAPNPVHRHVGSAFGEVYVPIVGDDDSVTLLRKLVLSAAVRADHYSDFGETTNPKIGLLWQPFSSLNVRGSYDTSFRAPTVSDLSAETLGQYITTYPLASPSASGTVPVFLLSGTNPDLKPETARIWSVGFDYQPSFLDGAKLSLDYYNVHFTNRIAIPPIVSTALENPAVYGSLISTLPNNSAAAAYLANAMARGFIYQDDVGTGASGVRYVYNAEETNESAVFQSGFDITAGYPFQIATYNFDSHFNAAVINQISTTLTPGAEAINLVNTYSNPLHFRFRSDVTWLAPEWQVTAAVNYANSYRDTSAVPIGSIASMTTVDLNIQYSPKFDYRWYQGLTLSLSVINLFDVNPPFAEGTGTYNVHYDVGNASPLGRFITIGLKKAW
jgi:iron complex outermembrane recepter protein